MTKDMHAVAIRKSICRRFDARLARHSPTFPAGGREPRPSNHSDRSGVSEVGEDLCRQWRHRNWCPPTKSRGPVSSQLGRATLVTMMKAADLWDRHQAAVTRHGDGARNRGVVL